MKMMDKFDLFSKKTKEIFDTDTFGGDLMSLATQRSKRVSLFKAKRKGKKKTSTPKSLRGFKKIKNTFTPTTRKMPEIKKPQRTTSFEEVKPKKYTRLKDGTFVQTRLVHKENE